MELTIEQALRQGVTAHREGKLQEAERLYRAILQSQPTHPDANHNLGVLEVSVNKADAALPLFKTALEENPKIEQFWLSYIDALIKEQQFDNAKEVLEQGKKEGLSGEKLNALEAQLTPINQTQNVNFETPSQQQLNSLLEYYQTGRYGDAEQLALSITQEFPEHQFAWKTLGAVLKQTGRISESLVANQKTVQLAPKDFEAHFNLGLGLQELGKLEEAEASYRQAIALKSNFFGAHYNLGNTLKELGRLDEAEASYTQAIALKPDYAEAHNNLGITLQELARLEEAEASYRQAMALKPDYPAPYDRLGFILQTTGRFKDAEVCYQKYIDLKPNALTITKSKGSILFSQGEFERALSFFDKYNTRDSRAAALESLYALGRTKDIYERLEAHIDIDSKNIRVAAIAAFIAEVKKKKTAHNFCNNPSDFIYFSNISSSIENSDLFIRDVIAELAYVKTRWEPVTKATLNGFQADIDVFKKPAQKMSILKSIIIDELDLYYSKFKNEYCTYINKWPSKKSVSGWHVILKQQGHQTAHIHPDGWLSGVIYLKTVPSLGRDEGAIEFSCNSAAYSVRWSHFVGQSGSQVKVYSAH